jgi:enamine deaminase RidA (YjgF/YER057c/UK114 family)
MTKEPVMTREDHFNMWTDTQHELGYTQAIRVGPTVYVSGTAALDEKFQVVSPGDLGAQRCRNSSRQAS